MWSLAPVCVGGCWAGGSLAKAQSGADDTNACVSEGKGTAGKCEQRFWVVHPWEAFNIKANK